jgi:hypothetical protein
MQKMLRGKCYDTETATLLGTFVDGVFGDPAGYEERLYRNPEGFCFLYTNGGEDSPYPKESIKPISKVNADKWLAEHDLMAE